jgi:magnesium-transporting ATPase (P-type)
LKWEKEFQKASCAIENRDHLVSNLYDEIETNLQFLGASAIEDALQEKVPETIQALRDAGIIVWMLTGDKLETAIQISYSCRLISDPSTSKLMYLKGESAHELKIALQNALKEAELVQKHRELCCIVEGKQLVPLFTKEATKEGLPELFVQLADMCKSVVCCRMNPIQKGQIVKLMKGSRSNRHRTLAIGDGGNDVAMLREADVGVGISGKEGLQAVRAADYGISEFQYLKRLVLVHGMNSHKRMAQMAHFTIYKAWLVALNQLFYSGFSLFSGAPVLDSYVLTTFNTLFTMVLPFVFVLDKHASDRALERIPELYHSSQAASFINAKTLFTWFLYTLFSVTIMSSFTYTTYSDGFMFGGSGRPMDYWTIGYSMLSMLMNMSVTILFFSVNRINIVTILLVVYSYALFVSFTTVWTAIPWDFFGRQQSHAAFLHLLAEPQFYLLNLLVLVVTVLPYVLVRAIWQTVNASPAVPKILGFLQDSTEYVRQKELAKRAELSLSQNQDLSDSFYESLRYNLLYKSELSVPTEKTSLLGAISKQRHYDAAEIEIDVS